MTSNGRAGSIPARGTNINNLKFSKIMPENEKYKYIYNKKDIKKDCKYCQKTDKNSNFSDYAYGFECILKRNKRKCNRCKSCYFGH